MPLQCFSLQQRPQAVSLGKTFAQNFAADTAGLGKGEIVLFRALQKSLTAIANPPQVVVEEYHGPNHQVTFTGSGTYSRANARCELSDLMVIVLDRQARNARLTYIQAKSERSVNASAQGIAGSSLVANLEQWDLLARRPQIKGAPSFGRQVSHFNPPPHLLSSAQLDSVGSFAFFLHGPGGVDIYYAAASRLQRPQHCASRHGKLVAVPDMCRCGPFPECLAVYGNTEFGAFLFGLMIGTPILLSGKPTSTPVGSWLAAQLRGLAAEAVSGDRRTDLANELADLLDPDRALPSQTPNVGATTVLLFGVGLGNGRRD